MGIKISGSDAGGFRFDFSGANRAAGGSAGRWRRFAAPRGGRQFAEIGAVPAAGGELPVRGTRPEVYLYISVKRRFVSSFARAEQVRGVSCGIEPIR